MSECSSFDHLSDLEPEVISRSESVEPEEDARLKELLAKIETLTLKNEQLIMMHQMESLRIQEQENLEVKFKALLEEETEKSQGFLHEMHHLKEDIESMYTYCDVLDGDLSKLKAEPNFANVLQLEELCASQKQTIAKLEQELEVASNAQKSRSEEAFVGGFQPPKKVKHLCQLLETVVPLYSGEFNEELEQLNIQEQKATFGKIMEQCQPPNSLASIFNGEWKYLMSQSTGTMKHNNSECRFEHFNMIYELTDTHFIAKSKRNGICTVDNILPLNEAVVSGDETATTTIFHGIGIQTDIHPNSQYPQGCRVIRLVVDDFLVIGVSSRVGTALVVFTRV